MGVRDLGGWVFLKNCVWVITFTLGFCISEKYQWIAGTEEEKQQTWLYSNKSTGLVRKLLKKLEHVQLVQEMTKVLYDKCLVLEDSWRFKTKELFIIQRARGKSNVMILQMERI